MIPTRKPGRRAARSGQAIVLVALSMVALLAFVVLAIDGGNFYNQRRVVQNAADVSALAGLHFYYGPPAGVARPPSNDLVRNEIVRVAGINGIPDATNNLHAYWLNTAGDYVNATTGAVIANSANGPVQPTAEITSSASLHKPDSAAGIRVRPGFTYPTFIGTIIGQAKLAVQADGVAMQITIPWTDPIIDYSHMSAWMGGSGCGTTPVLDIGDQGNSNSFDFGGNAYINGGGVTGSGNSNQGLFKSSNGTAYFAGAQHYDPGRGNISTGWTDPYGASQPFPEFFYYQSASSPRHLVQAEDFRPSLDAAYTHNYIYQDYMSVPQPPITANYFHTLSVDFATQQSNSAAQNGSLLATAMGSGQTGIYFVDGDVNIGNDWTGDMGVVATGHVYFTAGAASNPVGHAAQGWGMGLSVLAGAYPAPGLSPCAVQAPPPSTTGWAPVFSKGSEQASWDGTIYAPNGLVDLSGNFNNGHSLGPVIANAMSTGDSSNANNQNFGTCASCWVHPPTYSYDLHQ